jgi:hypothetical protein
VGLDLKRPRWPVLALIAVGAAVVVAIAVGVIAMVAGGDGGKTTSSGKLDTSFTAPAEFESVDAVYEEKPFACGPTDSQCVRKYLVSVTADYGPQASLGVMERLQQEGKVDRSVNDHDMAHSVGRETAKDYGSNFKAFDLCPVSFNYGCSHGFFEYVLARTDTPKEAATTICESRSSKDTFLIAGFTCYHGVGHGIMMAEAYNVQSSLKACDTLQTREARDGCWQGVFMENVNAGMAGRALRGVFKRRDPLAPCNTVADKYKHECYINHSGWLMTVSENDLRKGSRYCLKAKGRYLSSCFQSIGLMVTNPVWQASLAPELAQARKAEASIAAALCSRFPPEGRKDCVIAGVDNLANFDRLETRRSKAFCEAVPSSLGATCYRQVGVNLANRTNDEEVIRQSCSGLGAKQRLCLAGARIGSA